MGNKISIIIMAILLAASVTGMAIAASVTCTVENIENGKVILNCGDKADTLEQGTEVKVRTVVKRAVEGC